MDEKEIKKLLDELNDNLKKDLKEFRDEQTKLVRSGVTDALAVAKIDKLNEAMADKDTKMQALREELDALKTAVARPGGKGEGKTDKEAKASELKEYERLMLKYMRNEMTRFTEDEEKAIAIQRKALSVDDDAAGGFLVHPEREQELLRNITEFSPMRQLSNVKGIGSDVLEVPRRTQGTVASWVGERQSRTESQNPTFGVLKIPADEMQVLIPVTQRLVDDAFFNVEAFVNDEAALAFAVAEATAFVSGSGSEQPRGILAYAAGTADGQIQQVNSGAGSTVTADGFIDTQYALKSAYAAQASWMVNRDTIKVTRKLKDGQGRWVWQPGLVGTEPSSILGRPVFEATDMPVVGAGNLVAVFADFKRSYQIADRMGTRLLRDPFTDKPNIIMYFTRRVGGRVKLFEGVKIMKCSA